MRNKDKILLKKILRVLKLTDNLQFAHLRRGINVVTVRV